MFHALEAANGRPDVGPKTGDTAVGAGAGAGAVVVVGAVVIVGAGAAVAVGAGAVVVDGAGAAVAVGAGVGSLPVRDEEPVVAPWRWTVRAEDFHSEFRGPTSVLPLIDGSSIPLLTVPDGARAVVSSSSALSGEVVVLVLVDVAVVVVVLGPMVVVVVVVGAGAVLSEEVVASAVGSTAPVEAVQPSASAVVGSTSAAALRSAVSASR